MAKPESPSEPFKRAVATAVRSLAGEPELEVHFSSEPPSLKGLKARLPAPPRALPPHEVAFVRGTGDAYAGMSYDVSQSVTLTVGFSQFEDSETANPMTGGSLQPMTGMDAYAAAALVLDARYFANDWLTTVDRTMSQSRA